MKPKTKHDVHNVQYGKHVDIATAVASDEEADYDEELSVNLSEDELPPILFTDNDMDDLSVSFPDSNHVLIFY